MKKFTLEEAKRIGSEIGIDWDTSPFDVDQFRLGLNVELEHGAHDPETDVTEGTDDPIMVGKIAWAHLKELSDYYDRLLKMEEEGERGEAARVRASISRRIRRLESRSLGFVKRNLGARDPFRGLTAFRDDLLSVAAMVGGYVDQFQEAEQAMNFGEKGHEILGDVLDSAVSQWEKVKNGLEESLKDVWAASQQEEQ